MDPTLIPTLTPTPVAVIIAQPVVAVVDHTTQILAFLSPITLLLVGWAIRRLETIKTSTDGNLTALKKQNADLANQVIRLNDVLAKTVPPEFREAIIGRREGDVPGPTSSPPVIIMPHPGNPP